MNSIFLAHLPGLSIRVRYVSRALKNAKRYVPYCCTLSSGHETCPRSSATRVYILVLRCTLQQYQTKDVLPARGQLLRTTGSQQVRRHTTSRGRLAHNINIWIQYRVFGSTNCTFGRQEQFNCCLRLFSLKIKTQR